MLNYLLQNKIWLFFEIYLKIVQFLVGRGGALHPVSQKKFDGDGGLVALKWICTRRALKLIPVITKYFGLVKLWIYFIFQKNQLTTIWTICNFASLPQIRGVSYPKHCIGFWILGQNEEKGWYFLAYMV